MYSLLVARGISLAVWFLWTDTAGIHSGDGAPKESQGWLQQRHARHSATPLYTFLASRREATAGPVGRVIMSPSHGWSPTQITFKLSPFQKRHNIYLRTAAQRDSNVGEGKPLPLGVARRSNSFS